MTAPSNQVPAASSVSGVELPDFSQLATPLYGGRYELLSLIGVGGGGSVYRARDVELDEIVALKVLRKELLHDPATVERFRNEVRLARRVTHRNVARVYDIQADQPRRRRQPPHFQRPWSTRGPQPIVGSILQGTALFFAQRKAIPSLGSPSS